MCDQTETRDHMIQCKVESRCKWRVTLSAAMRKKMKTIATKHDVEEISMTALWDWIESGEMNINKFPLKSKAALTSQEHIGWRNLFSGKLSTQSLQLQGDLQLEEGKVRNDYIWRASIVLIALWKMKNGKVHGITVEL
jgi:hypothetical protein